MTLFRVCFPFLAPDVSEETDLILEERSLAFLNPGGEDVMLVPKSSQELKFPLAMPLIEYNFTMQFLWFDAVDSDLVHILCLISWYNRD